MSSETHVAILGYGGDAESQAIEAAELAAARYGAEAQDVADLNLLTHGSFESVEGWTVGAGWTVPSPSASAFHGENVAQLVTHGQSGALVSDEIAVSPTDTSYFITYSSRMVSREYGAVRSVVRTYDEEHNYLEEFVCAEHGDETEVNWVANTTQFSPTIDEEVDYELIDDVAFVRIVFEPVGSCSLNFEVDGVQVAKGEISTTFSPAPNEDIDGSAILPGTVPPAALDTTAPSIPTNLAMTSAAAISADGTAISRVYTSLIHPTEEDYVHCEVQITGVYTQSNLLDPATRSPIWDWASTLILPKDAEQAIFEPAIGGAPYWSRARSVDSTGNRSDWSDVAALPAAIDNDAPPIPTIERTIRGFRLVGVWWNSVAALDLSHYELRWRQRQELVASDASGGDVIEVGEWTIVRTRATATVVNDLETTEAPDVTYYNFQVRSVDLSGNVREGRTLPVAVSQAATAAATTVVLADGRGVILNSTLNLNGTDHSVRTVSTDIDGKTTTVTITPALPADVAVGLRGTVTFDSDVALVAADEPYAGWSPAVEDYPDLVGQADVAANSILSNMIVSGEIKTAHLESGIIATEDLIASGLIKGHHIDTFQLTAEHVAASGFTADSIKGGELNIGGLPDSANLLSLWNDAQQLIARFSETGMVFIDPLDTQRIMRFKDGRLEFTQEGNPEDFDDETVVWTTAIDARGVTADTILVGTAPGGHNSIPNSSFERTPFATAPTEQEWPSDSAWTTHLSGTDINIDDSTGSLRLTTATY